MLSDAVTSGAQTIGGWLSCAQVLARRLGERVLEPLTRLVTDATPTAAAVAALAEAEDAPERDDPQARVEEAKFYLGADTPALRPVVRVVDREEGELPRTNDADRLLLLPRDPWWIFAYWEVTPSTRLAALRSLGAEGREAREVLRVYDVTLIDFNGHNAWYSFDLELAPAAESSYVHVWQPAASYCVEIGLRTATGRFLALLRSNAVTTARATPAADTTLRWLDLGAAPPRPAAPPAPDGAPADVAERPSGSSEVHAPRPGR